MNEPTYKTIEEATAAATLYRERLTMLWQELDSLDRYNMLQYDHPKVHEWFDEQGRAKL